MVSGLVLVRLVPGKDKQALAKIKEVKEVSHVSAVYGRWDLVVDLEAESASKLGDIVVSKIRTIPGIYSTESLITTAI